MVARVGVLAVGAGIERDIGGLAAEVDRAAAVARRAAPAFVPAEDCREDTGAAVGVADGQVHMFDEGVRHGLAFVIRVDAAGYESSSEV